MTKILFDDPCILFALRRESAPFRRAFRPRQAFLGAPVWARFCGPALVVETGIGQANVARALDWLLSKPMLDNIPYVPRLLVFAGFAGALTPALQVGDIVCATEVLDHKKAFSTRVPRAAGGPGIFDGRLLTMDHLIATPEEKRRLAEEYGALAVDMESAVFAERCTQAGIPFACIRAISDEVTTALSPALLSLMSGGVVSPWRLIAALARHPFMIGELWRLGRDTKLASEQLAVVLGDLLTGAFDPGRQGL